MGLAVKVSAMTAVVACGIAMQVVTASAAESPSVYQQLAALNPGTSATEMRRAAEEYAADHGGSADAAAADALAEATSQRRTDVVTARAAGSGSSSGGDEKKPLPKAVQGDIFWWDSLTDHVGLYRSRSAVIHAPGRGKTVAVQPVGDVKGPTHTELMLVSTKDGGNTRMNATTRTKVADWAATKEGKPYNTNFAFNKIIDASKYNCSQLVWAAWKKEGSVDLDNGLSKGVYPGDIRNDRRTYVYRTSI